MALTDFQRDIRRLPSFVEAVVSAGAGTLMVRWARDSAYRFFPLVEDAVFGLTWAACGKDPGFSPRSLLAEARRGGHYCAEEISLLSFAGPAPDAAALGRRWHAMLRESERIIALLPGEEAGTCVLDGRGELFRGEPAALEAALRSNSVRYHRGTIRGAWPKFMAPPP